MKFDANRRRRLALLARLASIPDMGKLEELEQGRLVKEAEPIVPTPKRWKYGSLPIPVARRTWNRLQPLPYQWAVLAQAHHYVRPVLWGLVTGKVVSLVPLAQAVDQVAQLDGTLCILGFGDHTDESARLLLDLLNALPVTPFPFRLCRQCQKTVFVPTKNQLYCSAACQAEAVPPERRAQRLEYMRQRQRERYAKRKQQPPKQQEQQRQQKKPPEEVHELFIEGKKKRRVLWDE